MIRFDLHKTFSTGGFELACQAELDASGVTALWGESGAGKTSMLRCLAGLERDVVGSIFVGEECWLDTHNGINVAVHRRALGYVFQDARLFSHYDVAGNLAFAEKRAHRPLASAERDRIVEAMAVGTLLKRRVEQLSGGEKQRVAVARALLSGPRLLLLDEPLSGLDGKRKAEIFPYLERLHRDFEVPILYVSHALDEVARLADRVIVLKSGRVVQQGGVQALMASAALHTSGHDEGVVLRSVVGEAQEQWGLQRVSCEGQEIMVKYTGMNFGEPLRLYVTARDVSITLGVNDASSILNRLAVTVEELLPGADSASVFVKLRFGHQFLLAAITRQSCERLALRPGMAVWAQIKSVALLS